MDINDAAIQIATITYTLFSEFMDKTGNDVEISAKLASEALRAILSADQKTDKETNNQTSWSWLM